MKTLLLGLCLGMATCWGLVVSHAGVAAECAADESLVCAACGCGSPTRKVCRVVEDVAKKPKVSYATKCEDFCIPGKSELAGYRSECGPCGTKKCKKVWKPGCGEVASKRMLVKTTATEEKKTTRYEVVEVCDACAGHGRCVSCSGDGCGHGSAKDARGCAQATGESPDQIAVALQRSVASGAEIAPEPSLRVEPISNPKRSP